MKTSKMTDYDRRVRREKIMEKRGNMILKHDTHGRRGTRRRWLTTDKTYPHSNKRQHARYARQTGYVAPAPVAPAKPKRTRKAVA
jgi:hypothetical protein